MPHIIAQLPDTGGYVSVAKLVLFILFTAPWLYVSPWVQKDAKYVRAPVTQWCLAVLGAGTLGAAIWLILPFYFVGLLVYLVLTASALVAYVVYRNGRVDEESKVLTRRHLSAAIARRRERAAAAEPTTRVKVYTAERKAVPEPSPDSARPGEIEKYNLMQDLLYDILWCRASEVDLSPGGEQMSVRLVVDGVVTQRPGLSLTDGETIIQHLKQLAGMDPDERRRPQQGSISVDLANRPIDILVSVAGSTSGQRMQLRVVQEAIRQDLDELGISRDVLKRVREMAAGHGIIVVSGPPKSGVTSTLYSLLRGQDAYIKQLVTLEAKVVSELENVTQHAYGPDEKLPEMLAPALRRDPDVIMVDKCPDAPTAAMLTEAAAQKLVLLGMPARDSFSALAKWVKVCGDANAAVADLRGVLCQFLLRKICVRCREAYRPDPQLLVKANIPADQVDQFYRPPSKPPVDEKGRPIICSACQGAGYFERTAAFELLEVTDEVRGLVTGGSTLREIKGACRKSGMLYLQEQALRKVIAGQTSIKEVLRVSQQGKKK